MTRIAAFLLSVFFLNAAHAQDGFITLSSTTSTQDSGLFGHILPLFRAASGLDVHVVAVGTGQALAIGMRGDADALLVHDRAGEDKFVVEGYGIDRRDVMYNDFVIVGPKSDPAGIRGLKMPARPCGGSRPGMPCSRAGATTAAPTGWNCAYGNRPASPSISTPPGTVISGKAWSDPQRRGRARRLHAHGSRHLGQFQEPAKSRNPDRRRRRFVQPIRQYPG